MLKTTSVVVDKGNNPSKSKRWNNQIKEMVRKSKKWGLESWAGSIHGHQFNISITILHGDESQIQGIFFFWWYYCQSYNQRAVFSSSVLFFVFTETSIKWWWRLESGDECWTIILNLDYMREESYIEIEPCSLVNVRK